MIIELDSISVTFDGPARLFGRRRRAGRPLFRDFSLRIGGKDGAENPVILLGASGCGKTTLLRLIAGLLRPQAGHIRIDGAEAAVRTAFVFQEPRLFPALTALENVSLPAERALGKTGGRDRARRFLSLCSLDDCADKRPAELSGGQRHRVSIARAWAYPAPLVLMDEPFQSLDVPLRAQLMDAVKTLLNAENRRVVMVTHAPLEALYIGGRVVVLRQEAGLTRLSAFDERLETPPEKREFFSEKSIAAARRITAALS